MKVERHSIGTWSWWFLFHFSALHCTFISSKKRFKILADCHSPRNAKKMPIIIHHIDVFISDRISSEAKKKGKLLVSEENIALIWTPAKAAPATKKEAATVAAEVNGTHPSSGLFRYRGVKLLSIDSSFTSRRGALPPWSFIRSTLATAVRDGALWFRRSGPDALNLDGVRHWDPMQIQSVCNFWKFEKFVFWYFLSKDDTILRNQNNLDRWR